jgi:hypothetical protein
VLSRATLQCTRMRGSAEELGGPKISVSLPESPSFYSALTSHSHNVAGSVMNPLFQGATCLPQNAATGGTCDLGGLPPKTLKITTVAQVQLAVNFARNTGIRLIVHNTGHDYLGKSTGAGALSIWTNNLKSIDFIPAYSSASSSYTGKAMRLGAGVEVYELYEAANKYGVSAIGGECQVLSTNGSPKRARC